MGRTHIYIVYCILSGLRRALTDVLSFPRPLTFPSSSSFALKIFSSIATAKVGPELVFCLSSFISLSDRKLFFVTVRVSFKLKFVCVKIQSFAVNALNTSSMSFSTNTPGSTEPADKLVDGAT